MTQGQSLRIFGGGLEWHLPMYAEGRRRAVPTQGSAGNVDSHSSASASRRVTIEPVRSSLTARRGIRPCTGYVEFAPGAGQGVEVETIERGEMPRFGEDREPLVEVDPLPVDPPEVLALCANVGETAPPGEIPVGWVLKEITDGNALETGSG